MRRALSICAVLILVACGESTGPTLASVAGTWNLESINGSALPYTISQTAFGMTQVSAGTIVATRARTFTEAMTVRTTTQGQTATAIYSDSGTYSLKGNAVTFSFKSDGSTGMGDIAADTVTLVSDGLSFVYKKQ